MAKNERASKKINKLFVKFFAADSCWQIHKSMNTAYTDNKSQNQVYLLA